MRLTLYTNSISAHQLPLAREIVFRIGANNFRYIYTGDRLQGGAQEIVESEFWIGRENKGDKKGWTCEWLEDCDTLLSGIRDFDLFERRTAKGLKTFYVAERWFKPIPLFDLRLFNRLIPVCAPGWVRMFAPGYRRMAKRFVAWMKNDLNARCLTIGPWAKKDMLWLGVLEEKIVDWGYFIVPSSSDQTNKQSNNQILRILWVGRMLDWKRVDTIVRAVAFANAQTGEKVKKVEGGGELRKFSLTLVGDGPENERLQKLADKLQHKEVNSSLSTSSSFFHFIPPVSINEVRDIMRSHDVYVLSSNAQEGWGAALNEAMEEGMTCLGTYEAGASAALLPQSNLFHAGDWRTLADMLLALKASLERKRKSIEDREGESCQSIPVPIISTTLPAEYTPINAAVKLMKLIETV